VAAREFSSCRWPYAFQRPRRSPRKWPSHGWKASRSLWRKGWPTVLSAARSSRSLLRMSRRPRLKVREADLSCSSPSKRRYRFKRHAFCSDGGLCSRPPGPPMALRLGNNRNGSGRLPARASSRSAGLVMSARRALLPAAPDPLLLLQGPGLARAGPSRIAGARAVRRSVPAAPAARASRAAASLTVPVCLLAPLAVRFPKRRLRPCSSRAPRWRGLQFWPPSLARERFAPACQQVSRCAGFAEQPSAAFKRSCCQSLPAVAVCRRLAPPTRPSEALRHRLFKGSQLGRLACRRVCRPRPFWVWLSPSWSWSWRCQLGAKARWAAPSSR